MEHLPHSVSGVGMELARGDPDLRQFTDIRTIKPAELLGYVVVVSPAFAEGHLVFTWRSVQCVLGYDGISCHPCVQHDLDVSGQLREMNDRCDFCSTNEPQLMERYLRDG